MKLTRVPAHKVKFISPLEIMVINVFLVLAFSNELESFVLHNSSPEHAPITSGTLLSVTGEGFINGISACQLVHTSYGSILSQNNFVRNNSFMTCTLPDVNFIPSIAFALTSTVDLRIVNQVSGIPQISNAIPFTLFNLSQMLVTSINPVEGFNSSITTIKVHGTGFINTSTISCLVADMLTVTAMYENDTMLSCRLPYYTTPAQVSVDILINGQTASKVHTVTTTTNLFTYFSTSPEITGLVFTDSFARLLLSFDREVELGGEQQSSLKISFTNCSQVFSSSSVSLLGGETQCQWHNTLQQQILITLGAANVFPGSVLHLKENIIRTRNVAYSKLASGGVMVSNTGQRLQPVAVITGPQHIPFCGNVTFSGHESLSGGSQSLLFKWNISYNPSDVPLQSGSGETSLKPGTTLDPLELVPDYFTDLSSISLPTESFMTGIDYSFILFVQNFLGEQDSIEITITKQPFPAPIVWVVGGMKRTPLVGRDVLIEGVASLPQCLDDHVVLSFQWKISSHKHNPSISSLMSPVLLIPANTLLPGTNYTAILTVTAAGQTGNASVIITTQEQQIEAVITGGNEVFSSEQNLIILDGTASRGLTNDVMQDPNFFIEWSCHDITRNWSCDSVLASYSHSLCVKLASNVLPEGKYIFTLTLEHNGTISKAIKEISLLANPSPRARIFTPSSRLSAQDKLILQGFVCSSVQANASWSTVHLPGYDFLSMEKLQRLALTPITVPVFNVGQPLTESNPFLYINTTTMCCCCAQYDLVIAKDNLLPMNTYRFRLSITDTLNHIVYSEINITTESVPSGGKLIIEPITTSLGAKYLIQSLLWTDSPSVLPLQYRYGFSWNDALEDVIWLTGIIHNDTLLCRLPTSINNSITVVVEVHNSGMSAITFCKQLELIIQQQPQNLMLIYNDIHGLVINQGRWIEGLADTLSVLYSQTITNSSATTDTAHLQEFKRLATGLIVELFISTTPNTTHFHTLTLQALNKATELEPQTTNNEHLESVLRLLEFISTHSSIDSSYSAGLIFSIYGNLIEAYSHVQDSRIQSDDITRSFLSILPALGSIYCQSTGNFEQATHINKQILGTLKFYNSPVPAVYNLSCTPGDKGTNRCLLSANETSYIHFSRDVLVSYGMLCNNETYSCGLPKSTAPSSVCILSSQLIRDMYWSGSVFRSFAKTPFIVIHLINPQSGKKIEMSVLSEPVTIDVPLTRTPSSIDNLQCVLWNSENEEWESDMCTTEVKNENRVLCSCVQIGDLSVVEMCPPGQYGDMCQQVCPQGRWGRECSNECNCNGRGTCSAVDGSCDCDPGWIGANCQSSCGSDNWGKLCQEQCQCENGGACHHVDGSCDCAPGWIGSYCNITCPDGFHGKNCQIPCDCRVISECNKITGDCHCSPGYSGPSCHSICPDGSYGDNCGMMCDCFSMGTAVCDHINGSCNCLKEWEGVLCDRLIFVTPSPSPVPVFPVLLVVAPVVMVIAIVAITFIVILICWLVIRSLKKRKRKLKISPETSNTLNKLSDEISFNEDDEQENELEMTKAVSLVKLSSGGKTAKESFSGGPTDNAPFKEPEEMGGKYRWQITQIFSESKRSHSRVEKHKVDVHVEPSSPVTTEIRNSTFSNDGVELSDNETVTELTYKRGIYVSPEQTLKDLRNALIDSKQLDEKSLYFQFLRTDVPGDVLAIDTEEDTKLSTVENMSAVRRTVYIEVIDKDAAATELCVCGKFADMECAECKSKGYCSVECQQQDWAIHSIKCRLISAKRRQRRRSRSQHLQRKVERLKRTGFTPIPDRCSCGKEADFECAECSLQGYCSRRCQEKDWEIHRFFCKPQSIRATPVTPGVKHLTSIPE